MVRTSSDPQLLVDAVRDEVKRLDPSLAVADIQLMDEIVDGSVATPRFAFRAGGIVCRACNFAGCDWDVWSDRVFGEPADG